MIGAVLRRFVLPLAVASAALAVPLITPAWACGCGAYSPEDGGTATVPMETALVRVNADATEDVYLSLSVDSTVRSGALLFPVPDKAATVAAGPTRLFAELAALTDPPPPATRAPGNGGHRAGAGTPGVTVENRQQIGPLDVVTLSSRDAMALTRWLQRNGFRAKPALAAAAKPYTDAGWAFVAVRLRPGGASSAALRGILDPLRIHFASSRTVYPMRLSAMASKPERVRVYTLAPHRLDLHSANPGMTVSWAGRLSSLGGFPDLAKVASGHAGYLTRFDGTLAPASITDDFHFSQAASDAHYRPAEGRIRSDVLPTRPDASVGDHPVRDVALGLAALAVLAALLGGLARRQGRR
jgi:hypothetical protein